MVPATAFVAAAMAATGGHTFSLRTADGKTVPNVAWEFEDQALIFDHVKHDDRVLMLGGNIGGACVALSRVVANDKHIACVEPNRAMIPTLRLNRALTNSSFRIVDRILSRNPAPVFMKTCNGVGVGTCSMSSSDSSLSYLHKAMYTLGLASGTNVKTMDLRALEREMFRTQNFTFAAIDCEGCACGFAKEYPDFFAQLRGIILEVDGTSLCDYTAIRALLRRAGLRPPLGRLSGPHDVMLLPSDNASKTYRVFTR